MFVIRRRTPRIYKGFTVILEDGSLEKFEPDRLNGFQIIDDNNEVVMVQNEDEIIEETEKRKGGDGLINVPLKRLKLMQHI